MPVSCLHVCVLFCIPTCHVVRCAEMTSICISPGEVIIGLSCEGLGWLTEVPKLPVCSLVFVQ